MKNNSYEKYIDGLKEIEKLSADSFALIKDLNEYTRREINAIEEYAPISGDWEKWTEENDEIVKILKRTINELNKFTDVV